MPVIADWVLNWQKVYQAQADSKYAGDLMVYEQNRTDWVVNGVRARETGATVPPPPTIPKHTLWSVAENGVSLKQEDVQDPAISNPVLPPPPKPSATPLVTHANTTQDAMMQVMMGILEMLAGIKADLAAMKAK